MRWEELKNGKYLFKYRDWHDKNGYHRKILEDKQLYLSNPNDFEDKLDCHYKETLEDKEIWAVSSYVKIFEHFGFNGLYKWVLAYNSYEKSSLSNPEFEDNWEKRWRTFIDEKIRVLSLALVPDEEELWNKYAKNHTGFCLALEEKDFKETLSLPYIFWKSDIVTYQNSEPQINMVDFSDDEMYKRIFTKLNEYEFEHEYRCIRLQLNDKLTPFIPIENSLRYVIVGKDMNEVDEQDLRNVVNHNWTNVQVINEKDIES